MSCLVLLNAKAGTLLTGRIADPRALVQAAFDEAGRAAEVVLAEPDDLARRLRDSAVSDFETVVVGGGDGSFSHALSVLAGSGKTLGHLPLGTMNLLGRDLGFSSPDLAVMARELAAGEARDVDYGTINGEPFHTLCGLGYFSRVAREREQTRSTLPFGRLLSVALSTWRSFSSGGRMRIAIRTGDTEREIDAYALMVTNNRVGADWRRSRLDEGLLELHVMRDVPVMHRARAGFELLAGKWREGDIVETLTAERFEVASVRSRLWTTVDGELRRERTPLAFDVVPGGISLLMPKVVGESA